MITHKTGQVLSVHSLSRYPKLLFHMSTHAAVFQATTNLGWYLVMHTTNTKPFFLFHRWLVKVLITTGVYLVPIARVYCGVLEITQGEGPAQNIEAALVASFRG